MRRVAPNGGHAGRAEQEKLEEHFSTKDCPEIVEQG